MPSPTKPTRTTTSPPRARPAGPFDAAAWRELEALLDAVGEPFEPLDVGTLDGFLCGVIVQPRRVAEDDWLGRVADVDGRALPSDALDLPRLHALVRRRHGELAAAIAARRWFDPLVFTSDDDEADPLLPFAAGFATALALYPSLLELPPERTLEPLALVYRHLDPDDLDDAADLIEEIASIEPPADLDEAVEDVVRAVLLLADASVSASRR